jgi:hypothetical protein
MKFNKHLVGIYGVYAGLGVLTGLLFSKSQYYKGHADAYMDVAEDLTKLSEEIGESISKAEEKKEEA